MTAVRVENIDFVSKTLKFLVKTIILVVCAICAVATSYGLIVLNKGNNSTESMILIIIFLTILWMFVMYIVITHKKKVEYKEIQIDRSGNLVFKHKDTTITFNILVENSKNNLKILLSESNGTVALIIKNLNNKYRIEIFDNSQLKIEIQSIANKGNIVIKEVD